MNVKSVDEIAGSRGTGAAIGHTKTRPEPFLRLGQRLQVRPEPRLVVCQRPDRKRGREAKFLDPVNVDREVERET